MLRKMAPVLLVALFLFAVSGCGDTSGTVVATVDGNEITRGDLDERMKKVKVDAQNRGEVFPDEGSDAYAQTEKETVQQLVDEEVMRLEAIEMGIDVSEEADAKVDQQIQSAGGEEQLLEILQKQDPDMTIEKLRETTSVTLWFNRLIAEVTKEVVISDEEALVAYNEQPAAFIDPNTLVIRHILVADEQSAQQVKARLEAGEDISAVAAEVSIDPGSKDKGGDVGKGPFVAEFQQALEKLVPGQISEPVKSEYGYHIIMLEGQMKSFDEAKEQIKFFLAIDPGQVIFFKWLDDVKLEHDIEIAEEYQLDDADVRTSTEATATAVNSETAATE